jgi:hypothetical protein
MHAFWLLIPPICNQTSVSAKRDTAKAVSFSFLVAHARLAFAGAGNRIRHRGAVHAGSYRPRRSLVCTVAVRLLDTSFPGYVLDSGRLFLIDWFCADNHR